MREEDRTIRRRQQGALRRIMRGDYLPVAFVGSGISRNYPDWCSFIEAVAETGGNVTGLATIRNQHGHVPDLESLLMIADDALENIDKASLRALMSCTFPNQGNVPSVFNSIVRASFAFYITTNYDTNIERAFQQTHGIPLQVVLPDRIGDALAALHDGRPFLLKLHGCAHTGSRLVIGHDDYREAIYNDRHLRYVLAALLATRPIVFIGYGHRDPHISRYLDYERSVLPRPAMQRFAFIRQGDSSVAMGSNLRRLNVTRLELSDWSEVETILDQCSFLRIRDRYQRARVEYAGDFARFVEEGRQECAWGAVMYAYAASDLGHAGDVRRLWSALCGNTLLRGHVDSVPALQLATSLVAGQMFKRAVDPTAAAAAHFRKAEELAEHCSEVLIPMRALALRYSAVFCLRPAGDDRSEFRDVGRSRALMERALALLGDDFPEERLDVEKWQAYWVGDVEGPSAGVEHLLRVAEVADKAGYAKNAAWCRYGAAEQALVSGACVDGKEIEDRCLPWLRRAQLSFEELQHPRGLGAVHYLTALALFRLRTLGDDRVGEVRSHLHAASAMAFLSGDVRLETRCAKLFADVSDAMK